MFDLNSYLLDNGNLLPESYAEVRGADYFKNAWAGILPMRRVRTIRCADGLEFSAQASVGHYCSPRKNLGPWVAVEVGFPTQRVEEFMEYAENPAAPTDTVYGWVPVEVVEAVVRAHGGLAQPAVSA
jgi:hypothetical protein